MNSQSPRPDPETLVKILAEFRYQLRRFLHFSEGAAIDAGLQPQQHQLLLQIAGAPVQTAVTVAYAAERLGLKHNSTVELVDRSVREGLLTRKTDAADKRRVILHLTLKGRQILRRLAGDHARELNELAPQLAHAMKQIRVHASSSAPMENR